MDTLKVVQAGRRYFGVYHHCADSTCQVRLARSSDLSHWSFVRVLDAHASQPYLSADASGGFVLAVESATDNHLRLRHYPSASALLSAHADRLFDARRTLSPCAEGTPSILSVTPSTVRVRFHYYAGCRTDREAVGTLTSWRQWSVQPDVATDTNLSAAGAAGKHGDRDTVRFAGRDLTVYEGQLRGGEQDSWRLFVLDPGGGPAVPMRIRTPGGSRAFANPAVTGLSTPRGARVLFVAVFLPVEGVAGGDAAGELTYTVPLH